jgi:hypothetical protein
MLNVGYILRVCEISIADQDISAFVIARPVIAGHSRVSWMHCPGDFSLLSLDKIQDISLANTPPGAMAFSDWANDRKMSFSHIRRWSICSGRVNPFPGESLARAHYVAS